VAIETPVIETGCGGGEFIAAKDDEAADEL